MAAECFETRVLKRDARSVLLPLDLSICTMDDPLDLFAPHRFTFDTVMPTVGFHVKFVQKLVAGYATVAFSGSAPFDPTFDAAENALKDLAQAGAQRIIMISEAGQLGPEQRRLKARQAPEADDRLDLSEASGGGSLWVAARRLIFGAVMQGGLCLN